MDTALHGLVFLGAVQALFLAALLIHRTTNSAANRVYAALLILVSLGLALAAAVFTGFAASHPWVYLAEEPLSWFYGPLVFLYARTLLPGHVTVGWRDALHFLVGTVHVITVILLLSRDPAEYAARTVVVSSAGPTLLRYTHGLVYSGVALLHVLRSQSRAEAVTSREDHVRFCWLIWFIGLTGGIWLIGAVVFLAGAGGVELPYPARIAAPLTGAIVIYVCGYISLRQPVIFLASPGHPGHPGTPLRESAPSGAGPGASPETDMIHIDAAMEDNSLWRDPELTLERLAIRTGLPSYRVSRAINAVRQESFFTYVNRYRIAEVQHRLDESSAGHLLDIAFAAGFSTKSSFNLAFKRFVGTTPSQYRRRSRTPRHV